MASRATRPRLEGLHDRILAKGGRHLGGLNDGEIEGEGAGAQLAPERGGVIRSEAGDDAAVADDGRNPGGADQLPVQEDGQRRLGGHQAAGDLFEQARAIRIEAEGEGGQAAVVDGALDGVADEELAAEGARLAGAIAADGRDPAGAAEMDHVFIGGGDGKSSQAGLEPEVRPEEDRIESIFHRVADERGIRRRQSKGLQRILLAKLQLGDRADQLGGLRRGDPGDLHIDAIPAQSGDLRLGDAEAVDPILHDLARLLHGFRQIGAAETERHDDPLDGDGQGLQIFLGRKAGEGIVQFQEGIEGVSGAAREILQGFPRADGLGVAGGFQSDGGSAGQVQAQAEGVAVEASEVEAVAAGPGDELGEVLIGVARPDNDHAEGRDRHDHEQRDLVLAFTHNPCGRPGFLQFSAASYGAVPLWSRRSSQWRS